MILILAEADRFQDVIDLPKTLLGIHEVLVQPRDKVLAKLPLRFLPRTADAVPVVRKLGLPITDKSFTVLPRFVVFLSQDLVPVMIVALF